MSQLSVTMTAEEADLFAKLTTLVQKTAESEAAFKKSGEASVAAANATKAAAEQTEAVARATAQAAKESEAFANSGKRLADQLLRSNETLEESYQRQQNQIKAAFESGKIGAKEYENSLTALRNKTEQIKESQARAALESTEAFQKANREAEAGVAIIDRLKVANTSLIEKYRQMAREVTQAHLAGKVSAEDHRQAIDRLKSEYSEHVNRQDNAIGGGFAALAMGAVKKWGTIGTAVWGVNQFIKQQNEEIERGTRLLEAREKGAQDLASVSSSPKEAVERNMQVEELETKFGVSTQKATNTVFALDSANLIQDNLPTAQNFETVRKFGRWAAIGDPEQLARVAGLINKTTGLAPDQAANMVAAASESTRINQAEIARELDMAMGGAGQFSQVEDRVALATQTAAITAKIGQTQPSPGTLVRSAFMKLVNQGRDLLPLEALSLAAKMDDEELKETFGDEQSIKIMVQSFRDDRDEFEAMAEMTAKAVAETGTPQDYMMGKINNFEVANPNLVALREKRQAEAIRNYQSERAGSVTTLNKAAYDRAVSDLRSSELPMIYKAPQEMVMGAMAHFADIFNIQLKGHEQTAPRVRQEQILRDMVTAEMMGQDDPAAVPSPDAAERHSQTLEVLSDIRDGIRQPAMPPLVTRPGDDR